IVLNKDYISKAVESIQNGQFSLAINYFEKGLECYRAINGDDSTAALLYYSTGLMYAVEGGGFNKAKEYFEKALAILKQFNKENSFKAGLIYFALGKLYCDSDTIKSIQNFERCLSIRLAVLGEFHLDVAVVYEN